MTERVYVATYAGLRPATGKCVVCRGVFSFDDAPKDAPEGVDPLCQSETGRLAHLCRDHRSWVWRVKSGVRVVL